MLSISVSLSGEAAAATNKDIGDSVKTNIGHWANSPTGLKPPSSPLLALVFSFSAYYTAIRALP
jgi:hypothetical protein